MRAQGEDRSSYQSLGPWNGLAFGFCKATEGTSYTDPAFAANWAALRREGKRRGAYHFFHPGQPVIAQAELFLATVASQGLEPGDMLAIDAEIAHGMTPPSQRHQWIIPSLPQAPGTGVGTAARQFLDEAAAGARIVTGGDHCPVLCYSYLDFLPLLAACTTYPLWVASYSAAPPQSVAPWEDWTFWQYCGGGGYSGADQDAYNGTPDQLDTWISTYTAAKPGPAPGWTETLMQELPELRQGAAGPDVRTLQACLTARGRTVAIDGAFGPATSAALHAFQTAAGLPADGIAGPLTWRKLLNR